MSLLQMQSVIADVTRDGVDSYIQTNRPLQFSDGEGVVHSIRMLHKFLAQVV